MLLKPSAVHFAIAAVMLRRGRLARYMPPIVTHNVSERVLAATGYAWATLMIALGLLNIYIAMSFSIEIWAWWISVGAFGAKIAALIAQFVVFRMLVRRNKRLCHLRRFHITRTRSSILLKLPNARGES